MRRAQLGFMSPRSIAVLVILLALLFVPLWWLGEKAGPKNAAKATAQAPQGSITSTPNPAAKIATHATPVDPITPDSAQANGTSSAHNPEAFGMSWGVLASDKVAAGEVWMSCHGQPTDGLTRPHEGSCNPYQGDSSCRLALPILCLKPDGSQPQSSTGQQKTAAGIITDGWAGGPVASTAPVAGFVLGSVQEAHARCEKALGLGWRMADFHGAPVGAGSSGGWGFIAKRGDRLDTRLRHWVHIKDQPGNCWNNR
jgi:hypothetical protein